MHRFYLGCALFVINGALAGCSFDSSAQPGGPGVGGSGGAGSGGAGPSSSSTGTGTGSGGETSSASGSSSSGAPCACDEGLRQVAALADGWSYVDLAADAAAACPAGSGTSEALSSLASACECQCGKADKGALCPASVDITLNEKDKAGCGGTKYTVTGDCNEVNLAKQTRYAIAAYPAPSKVACDVVSAAPLQPAFNGRACAFDATPLACDAASTCVAGEAPLCVKHDGKVACDDPSYPQRQVLYKPDADTRECGVCECESTATSCGGATVQIYSSKNNCGNNTGGIAVPAGADCTSFELTHDPKQQVRLTTAPVANTDECAPKAEPALEGPEPSDEAAYTVCCAAG